MQLIEDFHLERTVEFGVMLTALIAGLFVAFAPEASAQAIRVSPQQAEAAVIAKIAPVAPLQARLQHVTGTVVVDLNVSEAGSVDKVNVVSGDPILTTATIDAAQRWTFLPFQSDGRPCRAVVRETFSFGS